MQIAKNVSEAIGNTQLIDLSALIEGRATLLGKFEAQNPGGSVKDRAAKEMLNAAEKTGAPFFVRLQQPESNPPTWPRGIRG